MEDTQINTRDYQQATSKIWMEFELLIDCINDYIDELGSIFDCAEELGLDKQEFEEDIAECVHKMCEYCRA